MKIILKAHLKNLGPCLSSTIVDRLVTENHVSRENARKLISRSIAAGEINSLSKIFPKRENFLYLKEAYGSDSFWDKLIYDLTESGSALGLAISAVKARGGIMPLAHFGAASGSPVAMKKKLSYTTVLNNLISIGVFKKISLQGIGECIAIKQNDDNRYDVISNIVKARLITESVFINAVVQWAKNLNLVSYDSVRIRNYNDENQPRISNFIFDITAPSYLSPLVQHNQSGSEKPGFFACDVLLDTNVTLAQVKPFINKCRAIWTLKNVGRCIFIMAASQFTNEAFMELKKYGIIPGTPDNLFGNEIGRTLRELSNFIIYGGYGHSDDLTTLDNLMTNLAHINGATAQLQGALFEYLVAELFRPNGGIIRVGKLCCSSNNKKAESDVYIDKENRGVTFIECKGYKPYSVVLHKDVQHWIGSQIPVFKDFARMQYPNIHKEDIRVEFWTTGKLSEESQKSIQAAMNNNSVNKRYVIELVEAHQVRKRFEESRNENLISVYKKHFLQTFIPDRKPDLHEAYLLASGHEDNFKSFDDIF